MKKLLALFISVFLVSCGGKSVVSSNEELANASKQETSLKSSLPEDFEKAMPSSAIIRSSLIIFENTYSRVYSEDNVLDAAAGSKMAAVLKAGDVGFTMSMCSSLVLDGSFSNVGVSDYNAVVWSSSRIDFYSAFDCARYASFKKAFPGKAVIADNKIIEWQATKAVIRDAYNGSIIFNGDTGGNIVTAGKIGDKLVIVQDNGYVMSFRDEIKAFAIDGRFPIDFLKLSYADGMFYGVLKSGEFFTSDHTKTNITPYKNCILSNSSPYALCDGILTNGEEEYIGVATASKFSAGGGLYIVLNDTTLNIYSLKNSWQRFVSFDYSMPKGCIDNNGQLYFTGFSGKSFQVSESGETLADKIPEGCDVSKVTVNNGKFVCSGTECGTFSERVLSDSESVMYRRSEDGKVYYYFAPVGE